MAKRPPKNPMRSPKSPMTAPGTELAAEATKLAPAKALTPVKSTKRKGLTAWRIPPMFDKIVAVLKINF